LSRMGMAVLNGASTVRMTAITLDRPDASRARSLPAEVVTDLLWLYVTAQDRVEHIRVHVAPRRMVVVFFTLDGDHPVWLRVGRDKAPEDLLRELCGRMIQASALMPGWRVRRDPQ
jgi:hypothetical protein